jgi:hypothetical protein
MLLPDENCGFGRMDHWPQFEMLPAPPGSDPNYTRIRLTADFKFTSAGGRTFIAPAGFVCDGASIPAQAAPIIGHSLSSLNAPFGVGHDYLCRTGLVTKERADLIAYELARHAGHTYRHACEIWVAISKFGSSAWTANAAKRAECKGDMARLLAWA